MSRLALSIKQPWVTLILAGVKSVEVRRWSRRYTGELFLHTGRTVDRREVGWRLLPPTWLEVAELRSGLVGKVTMTGCKAYRSRESFALDQPRHLNLPDWFVPPVMYGFELADPVLLPFEPSKGDLYFFKV